MSLILIIAYKYISIGIGTCSVPVNEVRSWDEEKTPAKKRRGKKREKKRMKKKRRILSLHGRRQAVDMLINIHGHCIILIIEFSSFCSFRSFGYFEKKKKHLPFPSRGGFYRLEYTSCSSHAVL